MADSSTTRTRRPILWVVLVLFVLLAVWLFIRHSAADVVVVRTAQATRQDLVATVSTNGVTEPITDFQANAPVATVVKQVFVKEGDQVPAGKLLLTLDDGAALADVARAEAAISAARSQMETTQLGGTQEERLQISSQLKTAQAGRDAAQRNVDALKKLASTGAASPAEVSAAQQRLDNANTSLALEQSRHTQRFASTDVTKARASLADAQAQYAAAHDALAKLNVRTPVAGTVYSLPVFVSDYVQAGEKLLSVADLTKVRVRAYFDEPEIGKLKIGEPATIVWAAKPGRVWHGHIAEMPSSIIHYGTRNVGQVLIGVDDADGVLLPATNVTVTVTTFTGANVLQVPRESLHLDASGSYVLLLLNGRAVRRNITTGSVNMVAAQVLSGLNDGDTVVLGSVTGVTVENNMRVRTTP